MLKVAINGLGRIGRAAFKILMDKSDSAEIVAVNDLIPIDNLAYLLRYDTVYGRYEKVVQHDDKNLIIGGKKIPILAEKDPSRLPWKNFDIDVVFECTGKFTKHEDLKKHVEAGAKKVILSAPSKSPEIMTVIYGVTKERKNSQIISCASCTTNCITPVVEIFGRHIGLKKAIMTTIHAYTSSQSLVDGPNKNMPRGRAGACNFVPTSTGAAVATTKVLPQYEGKFNGVAVRGPVAIGSISDIVFIAQRNTSTEEINKIFKDESESEQYKGILGVTETTLVSSDIIKDSRASIVDLSMTQVVDGDLVKIMSWYDNEWGYSNQMVREAINKK